MLRRIRRLFRKSRAEKELERELRYHIERQIADNIAAGMSAAEARRRAQLEFGGIEGVKEEVRDARWETRLENLFRDFVGQRGPLQVDWRWTQASANSSPVSNSLLTGKNTGNSPSWLGQLGDNSTRQSDLA